MDMDSGIRTFVTAPGRVADRFFRLGWRMRKTRDPKERTQPCRANSIENAMSNPVIEVKTQEPPKTWTDQARLGADLLGPLVAAVFGIWVMKLTKRIEQNQWRNQKLIEKRIAIWDEIGPIVNDIYCYCKRIGSWKEMTPKDIIAKKRIADKAADISRPYFSDQFFWAYKNFTGATFVPYQAHGTDAKIRSVLWEHRNASRAWQEGWDLLFSEDFDLDTLESAYEQIVRQVQHELISN